MADTKLTLSELERIAKDRLADIRDRLDRAGTLVKSAMNPRAPSLCSKCWSAKVNCKCEPLPKPPKKDVGHADGGSDGA